MKQWKNLFAGVVLLLTAVFSTTAYGVGPYSGDGSSVITDTATGLEWQEAGDDVGRTWEESFAYCENSTLNGLTDWRLPNISELRSIVDRSRFEPSIDPLFSAWPSVYWSATTYAYEPDSAWLVAFDDGTEHFVNKQPVGGYVRCVRAGLLTGSFDLSVIWAGSGTGAVNFTPPAETCTADCSKNYPAYKYTEVTLTADSAASSSFSGWAGGGCSGIATCVVTMNQAYEVTATFEINTYTLTYTADANGSISGTSPQVVNSGSDGSAVTAVPATGYHFVQWSDASTANPRTDSSVTADISVTASFAINTYTLTYTAAANGSISGTSPQVVNSGNNGSTVTAVPAAGYHFVQWSDAATANPRTDSSVTADISVTASFAINTYTLTYTAAANGSISGTSPQVVNSGSDGSAVTAVSAAGYNFVQWSDTSTANPRTDSSVTADISVTASFAINNTYTLTYTAAANGSISGTSPQVVNSGSDGSAVTAVPAAGYHFVQWSDAATANPRTDSSVTADISVTASFAINTYTLTYTAAANGSISGTSPQVVNSGSDGSAVTAVPAAGYHFVQWSDTSTANPRTDSSVTADISVTASFAINTYTLTYTAAANGSISGTSPQVVNSGSDGSAVTAVPAAGYHFVQWSDAATANPRTDSSVTADISVTAGFAVTLSFDLSLIWAGSGTGAVNFTPLAETCTANCSKNYAVGTVVTLTAVSATGSSFSGWTGGGCSGTGTCVVTMSQAYDVTAAFVSDQLPPAIMIGPYASTIKDSTVLVRWITDEPTSGTILYGVNALTENTIPSPDYKRDHSVQLTGLAAATSYQLQVNAMDEARNDPTSSSVLSFTTQATPDSTPPVFVEGPVINSINHNSAVIEWRTDEPGNSVLHYGTNEASLDKNLSSSEQKEVHRLEIRDLFPNTLYYIQVSSRDSAGNGPVESRIINFTTLLNPDTNSPVIVNGPILVGLSNTLARIIWTTNEPATSRIVYSSSDKTGAFLVDHSVEDVSLALEHALWLTNLIPGELYRYKVSSVDAHGNGPVSALKTAFSSKTITSGYAVFTTLTVADTQGPLFTSQPEIVKNLREYIRARWTTTEDSWAKVEYGMNDFQQSMVFTNMRRNMIAMICGFEAASNYSLRVRAWDSTGNEGLSDTINFTTAAEADIEKPSYVTSPAVTKLSNTMVTIEWETSELSSYSLEYSRSSSQEPVDTLRRSSVIPALKQQVTLTDLLPGESYNGTITSWDDADNVASLQSFTFTTSLAADSAAPVITSQAWVSELGKEYAIIRWHTDEISDSRVAFGQEGKPLHRLSGKLLYVTEHEMYLSRLQPNTTYEVQVSSKDVVGNVVKAAENLVFKTSSGLLCFPSRNQDGGEVIICF